MKNLRKDLNFKNTYKLKVNTVNPFLKVIFEVIETTIHLQKKNNQH